MNTVLGPRARPKAAQAASSNNQAVGVPACSSGFWWLPLVGLVAVMLCAPFIRSVFSLGDEGVLLHGAERILRGRRLYVDFFEFLPPGGFVITAAWLGVVGTSMWSARCLAILTIAGIACFTYLACRQVSKHAPSSALVAIGWVVMSQGFWTQISHHWFTTLFSMAAAWATLASVEHPGRWLRGALIAGVAAGAAAMVTPTRGALAMLAAAAAFIDLRRHRVRSIVYVCASALVPTCLLAYLIGQNALVAGFDDVILFTAMRYGSIQSVPFAHETNFQNYPLVLLFPLAALLTLLTYVREWRTGLRDRLLQPCVAFGLAGLVGCFPRPDVAHIAFTAPLVCPLLAYCVSRSARHWLPKYRSASTAVVIGLCMLSPLSFVWISQTALQGEIVLMPRGHVKFWNSPHEVRQLAAWIAATPSEDAYFFYPFMPMLPFLTARQQVSKYDLFTPGYTLATQYQEACVSAMRHAAWVVIDRSWTDPDFLRRTFPAMRDAAPQETKRFEQALESGFALVAREGPLEMRRRTPATDEKACDRIEK